MAKRSLSTPIFILACAIAAALFILIFLVIGGRFDSGIPEPEEASVAEQERQDTVEQLLTLSNAASDLSTGEDAYAAIAERAAAYADGLGGLWVPWPDGPPEGATNPPVETTPPTDLTAEGFVVLYDATMTQLVDGLAAASDQDAPRYASMLLGLQALSPEGATFSSEPPGTDDLAALLSDSVSLSVISHAHHYFETAAARTDVDSRTAREAAATRLDALSNAIIDTGVADTREQLPALPDWFWADPAGTVPQLVNEASIDVVDHMVSLTAHVAPEDRILLVSFASTFTPFFTEPPLYPGT